MEALLRSCIMRCCCPGMGRRAGGEEELQCTTARCFSKERDFLVCRTVLKAILPLTAKILILVLFFPGQLIFPVRDALYANRGGTTEKKKSPESNHTHNLRPPGNSCLSVFVFSLFQFCTRYFFACSFLQSLMFVLLDLLVMNNSASCILQGSLPAYTSTRQ